MVTFVFSSALPNAPVLQGFSNSEKIKEGNLLRNLWESLIAIFFPFPAP